MHALLVYPGPFTPEKWCYVSDQTMPFQTGIEVLSYINYWYAINNIQVLGITFVSQ